eukprot:349893-Chlamydomonas_euryale.AAC.13
MDFVQEWIRIIEADETVWDQNAFNSLFKRCTGSKVRGGWVNGWLLAGRWLGASGRMDGWME